MLEPKFYYEDSKPKAKEGKLIEAHCSYVYDADTIYVDSNHSIFASITNRGRNNSIPIRFSGIDTPELGDEVEHDDMAESFYLEHSEEKSRHVNTETGAFTSTKFVTDLIENEDILLDVRAEVNEYGDLVAARDNWNRAIAIIYIKDKDTGQWINLNRTLLLNSLGTTTHLEDMNVSDEEKNEWRLDELTGAYIRHQDEIEELSYDERDEFLGDFDSSSNIRIGDTVLPINPNNITVTKVNESDPLPILRSNSSIMASSGHHNHQVQMTFFFDGKEHIDGTPKDSDLSLDDEITPTYYINGLRGLIAQFKLTPFLPVDNDNLNEDFGIDAITLQNIVVQSMEGFPHVYQVSLTALEFNHKAYIDTLAPFSSVFDWKLFRFYYQRLLEGVDTKFDDVELPFYDKNKDTLTFKVANMIKLQQKEDAIHQLRHTLREDMLDYTEGNTIEEKILHDYHLVDTALKQKNKAEELIDEFNIDRDDINSIDKSTWQEFFDSYLEYCQSEEFNDVAAHHQGVLNILSNEKSAESVMYYKPFSVMRRSFVRNNDYNPKYSIRLRSDNNIDLLETILENLIDSYSYDRTRDQYIIKDQTDLLENMRMYRGLFDNIDSETYELLRASVGGNNNIAMGSDGETYTLNPGLIEVISNEIVNRGQNREEERERIISQAKDDKWLDDFFEEVELQDVHIEDIGVSIANQVNTIPINMHTKPTHQYLGGKQAVVNIKMITDNPFDIHAINAMVDHAKALQLRYNNVIDRPIMNIENNLIDIFGFYGVHFQNLETTTLQGYPGAYVVDISFVGVYKEPEDYETLSRIHESNEEHTDRLVKEGKGVLDFSEGLTSTSTETAVDNQIKLKEHWDKVCLYPDLHLPKYNELPIDSDMYDAEDDSYVDPDFYALNIDTLFVENTINVLFDQNYNFVGKDSNGEEVNVSINNYGQVDQSDLESLSFQINDIEERMENYKEKNHDRFLDNGGSNNIDNLLDYISDYEYNGIQNINNIEDMDPNIPIHKYVDFTNTISNEDTDYPEYIEVLNHHGLMRIVNNNKVESYSYSIGRFFNTDSYNTHQNRIIKSYLATNWHTVIKDRLGGQSTPQFALNTPVSDYIVARDSGGQYIDDIKNISDAQYVGHTDFNIDNIPSWMASEIHRRTQSNDLDLHMEHVLIGMAKSPHISSHIIKLITYENYMEYHDLLQKISFDRGADYRDGSFDEAVELVREEQSTVVHDIKERHVKTILGTLEDVMEQMLILFALAETEGYDLQDIANGQAKEFLVSLRNNMLQDDTDYGLEESHINRLPSIMASLAKILMPMKQDVAEKHILKELKDQQRDLQEQDMPHLSDELFEELDEAIEQRRQNIRQHKEELYMSQRSYRNSSLRLRDKKERYLDAYHDMLNYDQRGRLIRAFPTYYMMLVDEGRDMFIWKLQDIFYEYNGIQNIEVVRSKENLADACKISLSNRKQNLSDPTGGYKYKRHDYGDTWQEVLASTTDMIRDFFNPKSEYQFEKKLRDGEIDSVQLQTGARIHLRMGYGSNPNMLPSIFNGIITELELGDQITFVAQSYGTELNRPISAGSQEHSSSKYIRGDFFRNLRGAKDILADQFCRQEKFRHELMKRVSKSFVEGNEPFIYQQNQNNMQNLGAAHRPDMFDKMKRHPSSTDLENRYFGYEIMQNIYDPEADPNVEAPKFSTFLYGKSTYDLLQTCAMAIPNYVASVQPFGLRNTVFYGHPSFDLAYEYDKDEVEGLTENVKTFRQMHVYGSYSDIISNQMIVSEQDIHTVGVPVMTKSGGDTNELDSVFLDADIYPEKQKKVYVDTSIRVPTLFSKGMNLFTDSQEEEAAYNFTTSTIKQHLQTMYDGNLIVLGDPTVKPHDYSYMVDLENQMNGSFEVNTVVHSISIENGFTTNITPDPIVSANRGFKEEIDFWLMGKKNFNQYYMPAFTGRMIANSAYGLITGNVLPSVTKAFGFGSANLIKKLGIRARDFGAKHITSTKKFYTWLAESLSNADKYFKNDLAVGKAKYLGGKMTAGKQYLGVKYAGFKSGVINYVSASQATKGAMATLNSASPVAHKANIMIQSMVKYTMKAGAGLAKLLSGPVGIIALLMLEFIVVNQIGKFFTNNRDLRNALTIMPLQHHGEPFVAGIEGHRGALIGDEPSRMDQFLNHPVFNFLFGHNEAYQVQELLADNFEAQENVSSGLLDEAMSRSGQQMVSNYTTIQDYKNSYSDTVDIDEGSNITKRMQEEIVDDGVFLKPMDEQVIDLFSNDSPEITFSNDANEPVFVTKDGYVISQDQDTLKIQHKNGFVSIYEGVGDMNSMYSLDPNNNRMAQSEFIFNIKPHAIKMEKQYGIPAPAIIAMGAHETGFGRSMPIDKNTGEVSNNLFGIKWHNSKNHDYVIADTWEHVNGERIEIEDKFRKYDSPYESVLDYADFLISNPRYDDCLNISDPFRFVECLRSKGYATDNGYVSKVHSIINQYNLTDIYNQKTPVFEGGSVTRNQHIGYAEPYFRYKLQKNGEYVDPLSFIEYSPDLINSKDMNDEQWINNVEKYAAIHHDTTDEQILDEKWFMGFDVREKTGITDKKTPMYRGSTKDILDNLINSGRNSWTSGEIKLLNPDYYDMPSRLSDFEKRAINARAGIFIGFDVNPTNSYEKEDYILELLEELSLFGIQRATVFDEGVFFTADRSNMHLTGDNDISHRLVNKHSSLTDQELFKYF